MVALSCRPHGFLPGIIQLSRVRSPAGGGASAAGGARPPPLGLAPADLWVAPAASSADAPLIDDNVADPLAPELDRETNDARGILIETLIAGGGV
jgi:hypothetical protein